MLKRWIKRTSRVLYRNPWWTYKLDTFQIPDGVSGEYHYVYTRGSSLIIPITDEGKIVFVNQYRYLGDRESIEFACGSVKEGDTYLETAHLELKEETGYQAQHMELAGAFNPYIGITCEICKVYLASGLQPCFHEPDDTEEFEVVYCTPGEVDDMIMENVIWDGMTLAAWMLTRHMIMGRLSQEK